MKLSWWRLLVVGLLVGLCAAQSTWAEEAAGKKEGAAPKLVYKPPMLGAPKARVGGGVRGSDLAEAPVLQVLAPDQAGATGREQPTLYWHLDRKTAYPVEVTLSEVGNALPLVQKELPAPVGPGLHALRLRGEKERLEVGKEYEWFVAVVLDPSQRSKDIIAGGGVFRVAAPAGLAEQASGAAYAEAGLWYDAVALLVEGLRGGEEARAQFQALLSQVGIAGVGSEAPAE